MSHDGASTRVARLAGYPWVLAVVVLAASFLGYLLLPTLAPGELGAEVVLILGILAGVAVGVAVGVALRLPRQQLAPLALGAFAGVLVRFTLDGQSLPFVLAVALVTAGEVLVIVRLARRSDSWRLRETGDLLRYGLMVLGVAAGGGALVVLATLADPSAPDFDLLDMWRWWVIDDLFGLIVITPAIATVVRPSRWHWRGWAEYATAIAITVAITYYVFVLTTTGAPGLLGWPYLTVLGSIWIAVRLGLRAAAPVAALQFCAMVILTIAGRGAMAGTSSNALDRLLAVEVFGISMTLAILALAILRDSGRRSARELAAAHRLFQEVVNSSETAIVAKAYDGEGADGRYVLANEASSRVVGLAVSEVIGRTDDGFLPPAVAAGLHALAREVMESRRPAFFEQPMPWPDGTTHVYNCSFVPLDDQAGRVWGVAGAATDITELMRSRERLVRQGEMLHAVFELSPTPALRLAAEDDGGVRVLAANAAMHSLLAARPGELSGVDPLGYVLPDDLAAALEVLAHAGEGADQVDASTARARELRLRGQDGRVVWVLMSAASVRGGGASPEIVAQFEDFTSRREAELALVDQVMRDAVTGLPNRRALHERMDLALRRLRRHPGSVTVLFCDLDRFKDVNDSLGHHVGDLLLVEVADRLRSALRPEDTVARLGGDEFVVVVEGAGDPGEALLLAVRMQGILGAPWAYAGQVFRPAMSIGIAVASDAEVSVDEILRRADVAMYRAKGQGRDRVAVYERSVDDEVQHAVSVQHDLRLAIDTGGLVLHYQPIVLLDSGRLVGAEALIRLRGRDGLLMSPGDFVPQAEVTGLVVPMGAWAIRQGLADLAQLREHGPDITLSINVSPTQLRVEGFSEYVLDQAALAGVDPACLAIEVTETTLLHDPARSVRELARLSDSGVSIALDDFGTGYSSLSWLTQFPVDIVKIDKSFTDDIGIDERKTAIISAVIAVSHELGFTVVAEGIESEEQVRRLLDLGCDRGQGYFYGRPAPIEEAPWTTVTHPST